MSNFNQFTKRYSAYVLDRSAMGSIVGGNPPNRPIDLGLPKPEKPMNPRLIANEGGIGVEYRGDGWRVSGTTSGKGGQVEAGKDCIIL